MSDNGDGARRTGRRWLWIIAGLAGVGAIAAVVAIWHLPDRMYPPGTDGGAEARAALQSGLLTAAAALTAVAGALIALNETRQANAETKRSNEAADVRERTSNTNTHVRELYVEAVKLLNEPGNLGIRLGGIYALERLAVDSPPDQRTVVEVLSAFVRTRTTDPELRRPPPPSAEPAEGSAADVRAAVQVLARLPPRAVDRADLTRADLSGPASLTALTFIDYADLHSVALNQAHLTFAQLRRANLTCTQLYKADLSNAELDGANLTGADLVEANLTDAKLGRAKLTHAVLRGADLTGIVAAEADLTRAMLIDANLTNAWLAGSDLTEAHMFGADLTGVMLAGVNLTDAQLDGANLTYARGLVQGQVDVAMGDALTQLPADVTRPSSW
ncbi:pentapeptide repeat-containing protein [Pseudofrankia sp. BMG5.37]|uniref:pentapeptide repeat-containing protein n=1 Tax=Pseudofrankia sp. BMG5.37 TaxID=3050035 RepID=UPI00289447D8|nr:pentapeptide repeat-containing protein [Pseudofrankia sp. BMG5.37]MDT3438721.1 pentapeptide repeat-containing protein [Pseudofrankia sp. BMG5.37]